ncbi:hypothetical protein C6499_21625 [Candidatus Poribacteria bacterium]|nr:MAG: hypothetical protein C6499_21625 [Candidatus Poribacteria bacterium]
MRCSYIPQKLSVLGLTLLLAITGVVAAQVPIEPPSGISGKVINSKGNPVAEFAFVIQPMQLRDGHLQPAEGFLNPFQRPPEGMDDDGMPRATVRVKTDADGGFTAANIRPGPVQINVIPGALLDAFEKIDPEKIRQRERKPPELRRLGHLEADKEILSIQIGKVTFFSPKGRHGPDFFNRLTFGLKPGIIHENVKITVKSRLRIHAQIVYADGTPVANAKGNLNMRYGREDNPSSGGDHGTGFFTDADGYFTQYPREPGFYTLSVEYNNLSGGAGPFLLKDGMEPKDLVITLDGNPLNVEGPPDWKVNPRGKIEPAKVPAGAENVVIEQVEVQPKVRARAAVPPQPPKPPKSVWVINPANGHAYKKIQCNNWHDAQQQAVEEGAHLVSINDEDEQHWLQVIFRSHSSWIGLTDVEKEGEWQWDSGEPVTYTNWLTQPIFPDTLPDTEKDYVVMTFRDGEWQSVGPESHFWRTTREAIIEKDGLVSTTPAMEASDEE